MEIGNVVVRVIMIKQFAFYMEELFIGLGN